MARESTQVLIEYIKELEQFLVDLRAWKERIFSPSCPYYVKNAVYYYMMEYTLEEGQVAFQKWLLEAIDQGIIINKDEEGLRMGRFKSINTVLNYDIGFPINKTALANVLMQTDGLYTYYNNTSSKQVTIKIPIEDKENVSIDENTDYGHEDNHTKSPKHPKKRFHTFLIYRSGSVTQSGPDIASNRKIRAYFMNIINTWRDIFIQESDKK